MTTALQNVTKNQAISLQILAKVASGMTIGNAMDSVLGAGTYDKLVSDLYSELRAKA